MFDRLFEWHPIGQDKILDNLIKNITDKIKINFFINFLYHHFPNN